MGQAVTISPTDTARSVLLGEAAALSALSDNLPEDLAAAVALLRDLTGKVVVSGVGKSGHVGRKIAATLSSLGTPATFLHPTEASHGDLGMVQTSDVCLLISNSGESAELAHLIDHCKRFSIPLIAISAGAGSSLMAAADLRLGLPSVAEGGPVSVAPMASSIIAMAMGDALAACLMVERGFGPADFAALHPGGKLGAQLARVDQLMHCGDRMPLVAPDLSMKDTVVTITAKGFGTAGVVAEGRLVGVITDGDVRRNIDALFAHSAGEIMTRSPITIEPGAAAARALALMEDRAVSALFVIAPDGAPLGILHMHDLLRAGVK